MLKAVNQLFVGDWSRRSLGLLQKHDDIDLQQLMHPAPAQRLTSFPRMSCRRFAINVYVLHISIF